MKKCLLIILCCLTATLAQAQPLPAQEVFQLEAKKVDPNTFSLKWQVKPGYFLYSDRIKVTAPENSNVQIAPLRLPPTLNHTDKQGTTYTVYRKEVHLPIGILGERPGESLIKINYQGCSDGGFCYPPETRELKVAIDDQLALTDVSLETVAKPTVQSKAQTNDKIANLFVSHNWFMILLTFFGFGLLLSFTPCILPMVPVLSGIIIGHGKEATTKKAFFLSLSYVLSMSFTYAVAGALVALVGANIQISFQSPWAISIFSLIFVLLALSMFGFYEFKLPDAWQAKIAGSSTSKRGGHYLGAAVMGCLSTLILSPCVTAPLIGVLTYIAQTGNVLLGALTLFVLSLGMGTPLLLIGTSAGKWVPGAGAWMNAVKAFFGVLLLAVAIYLMERILPSGVSMGLWACLLIFSGVYSGALAHSQTNYEKFAQGFGIVLLGYGLLILVGASAGASNPLQPLANLQAATVTTASTSIPSKTLTTLDQVQAAMAQAKGKPIMLDFYADWCASCKVMESTTFKDSAVIDALSRFVVIKIDVTENSTAAQNVMRHFNVVAPPTYLFFDAEGEELKPLTVVGESSASEFLEVLQQV